MSRGIIQTVQEMGGVFSNLEIREFSYRDASTDQPTLADLVLPGSGQSFSEDFTCLLSVLCANGASE